MLINYLFKKGNSIVNELLYLLPLSLTIKYVYSARNPILMLVYQVIVAIMFSHW